jgi:hypothetical protein
VLLYLSARKRPCTFSKDGALDTTEEVPKEQPIKRVKAKNNQNVEKQRTAEMLDKLANILPGEGKEGKWEIDDSKLKIKPAYEFAATSVELPSKSTQQQLIQLYFKHGYSTFPILPRKLFLKQFESNSEEELTQPLLLYVLFAFGAQYQPKPNIHLADGYFRHAKNLLDNALNHPRLSTVIALALMSLYDGNNERTRGTIYSAMSFQMCFDLNLMKDYSGDAGYYNNGSEWNIEILELRKRICWGCYYLDKMIHIQTGQPWMVRSRDIQLDMPLLQPGDDVTEHEILEVFVSSIKLLQMGERILQPEQQAVVVDHQMSSFNSDNELLHWLRSLPPHLQWTTTACIIPPIPPPNPPRSSAVCQLHLIYNLIELIVLKPYTTSHNKSIQQRSITVSTNIIRLITLLTEKSNWILSYTFILSTLMEAIRIQLKYCSSEISSLARHARYMFQQSIQLLQVLLLSRNSLYSTIHEFTTKLNQLLTEKQLPAQEDHTIYDILDPFVLQEDLQRSNNNNNPWSIDVSSVKTKSYTTPSISTQTHNIYNSHYHDNLFHTSWRAAMTVDRAHYPSTKIPLDFLHVEQDHPHPHPHPHAHHHHHHHHQKQIKTNQDYHHELSSDQFAALVAQIQETNEKSSEGSHSNNHDNSNSSNNSRHDNSNNTSHTNTPNNDDLLFTLLSESRQKDGHQPQHRQSFSQHPYMNVGLGIYASAHQHHSDVIRQHIPASSSNRPVILTHQGQVIVTDKANKQK